MTLQWLYSGQATFQAFVYATRLKKVDHDTFANVDLFILPLNSETNCGIS